jgi:hypothetical protein
MNDPPPHPPSNATNFTIATTILNFKNNRFIDNSATTRHHDHHHQNHNSFNPQQQNFIPRTHHHQQLANIPTTLPADTTEIFIHNHSNIKVHKYYFPHGILLNLNRSRF